MKSTNDAPHGESRTLVITGATGIAAATAVSAARRGWRIAFVSRTEEHCRSLHDHVVRCGGQAAYVVGDLRDEATSEALFTTTIEKWRRIDALYHVAGVSGRRFGDGPLHECSLSAWEDTLGANMTPLFLAVRGALAVMVEQDRDASGLRGTVLIMSSILGTEPLPGFFPTHAYGASKAVVPGLCRSLAAYYAPRGITINGIAPALTATPMAARAAEDGALLERMRSKQPLVDGMIDPDDVAETSLFYLSPHGRAITGQMVNVDAGWSVCP